MCLGRCRSPPPLRGARRISATGGRRRTWGQHPGTRRRSFEMRPRSPQRPASPPVGSSTPSRREGSLETRRRSDPEYSDPTPRIRGPRSGERERTGARGGHRWGGARPLGRAGRRLGSCGGAVALRRFRCPGGDGHPGVRGAHLGVQLWAHAVPSARHPCERSGDQDRPPRAGLLTRRDRPPSVLRSLCSRLEARSNCVGNRGATR